MGIERGIICNKGPHTWSQTMDVVIMWYAALCLVSIFTESKQKELLGCCHGGLKVQVGLESCPKKKQNIWCFLHMQASITHPSYKLSAHTLMQTLIQTLTQSRSARFISHVAAGNITSLACELCEFSILLTTVVYLYTSLFT